MAATAPEMKMSMYFIAWPGLGSGLFCGFIESGYLLSVFLDGSLFGQVFNGFQATGQMFGQV